MLSLVCHKNFVATVIQRTAHMPKRALDGPPTKKLNGLDVLEHMKILLAKNDVLDRARQSASSDFLRVKAEEREISQRLDAMNRNHVDPLDASFDTAEMNMLNEVYSIGNQAELLIVDEERFKQLFELIENVSEAQKAISDFKANNEYDDLLKRLVEVKYRNSIVVLELTEIISSHEMVKREITFYKMISQLGVENFDNLNAACIRNKRDSNKSKP